MRVTLGGFRGVTGGRGSIGSRTESRGFGRGADNGSVSTEGELKESRVCTRIVSTGSEGIKQSEIITIRGNRVRV